MSVAALDDLPGGRDPSGPGPAGGLLRWGGAALVVVALHAGGGWLAIHWRKAVPESDGLPPAILLDLAPVAAAPEGELTELPVGPPMTEAAPEPTPDMPVPPVETPPEIVPPTPLPVPLEAPDLPPPDLPAPDPLPVELDLPELPAPPPAAVILPPVRPAAPPKPAPPAPKKVETKKAINKELPPAPRTTAAAGAPTVSDRAAAPGSGMGSSSAMAPATWRGRLMVHLNRHKRFPDGVSRTGRMTVTVSVTIDRSGTVLSATVVTGSGAARLDRAAVALVKRASPVPAPPDSVAPGRSSFSIVVPVDYDQR